MGAGRMDATSQNHLDFAARVARIQGNIASAQQLLFVGADEVYVTEEHVIVASSSTACGMR